VDAIVRALHDALRGDVRLGEAVTAIEASPSGVTVIVGEQRIDADVGLCTLPPHLAERLDAPWGSEVQRALDEPLPFTTGKIGLEYGRRFWEEGDRIFGGVTRTERSARVIWYPSTGYLGDGGVIVGAYPFGAAAQRFSMSPHESRLDAAMQAGVAIHGDVYRDALRSSFSVDWATQPWSEGAWVDWRRYGPSFSLLLDPVMDGRWWFAGDWLSRAVGWQHGAIESARRAVTSMHERLMEGTG